MTTALDELRGASRPMAAIRSEVARLLARQGGARRVPPILILGETGTGKGLLARCIHQGGPRRDGPFVAINCAAIPENLLEAELFGYERGAFTDARQAKPGLFQMARSGTLFLDEIGLLPTPAQGKLLTALEDRAVRRLGGTRAEPVDVAVVAATSVDLKRAVADGRFRQDLYHRLAVLTLTLPPLRARGADILALAEHFLERACADYGLSARTFTPEARRCLEGYAWPGNVRELANAMERVALLSESDAIALPLLDFLPSDSTASDAGGTVSDTHDIATGSSDDTMRARMESALRASGGNIRRTAAALGIARNTLRARMDRYGLRQRDPARVSGAASSAPAQLGPIEWTRRHLAFLRVRVRQSSELDVRRGLDVVGEKIASFGGRIEEWSPTGLIAVFGLEPLENPSSHAALAALAVQNAAARAAPRGDGADVLVAIHCAEHLVGRRASTAEVGIDGKIATWSTLEYLVGADAAGAVVVSEAVAPFLVRRFALHPLHEPGRRAFRLLRADDPPPAAHLVPFIGRSLELDTLEQAAARAAQHHGQVVGIVGEAGLGKSRLLHEATRHLSGWRIIRSAGAPYARTTSYFAIVELLQQYCRIEDTDAPSVVHAKVTAALSQAGADPADAIAPILDLLAVLPSDDAFRQLDPAVRRRRTLEAIKRVIVTASAAAPLCVIVEDLHWIDPETEAALDALVESIAAARVLLLVNYRHEYQHRWGSRTYYHQLQIEPFSGESAEQFVRALLGENPALESLAAHLMERTEGNPFFLEESVRSLVEAAVLDGPRGAYRLTGSAARAEIPTTVQALLSARIDRLSPDDRHVLDTAAVIGKDFSLRLLQAMSDQEPEALRRTLGALQTAELIYEATVFPDLEYTFKHALTHEVAYESLLDVRRRTLHASAMSAIAHVYGERLDDHVERLAHHALRGERWEEAIDWCRRAATRAASRSAYAPAAERLEQALSALGHLRPTRTTTEQAVDVRLELRELLVPLGEQERNLRRLEEALPLAEGLGDVLRLGRVYLSLATAHWLAGDAARGLRYAEQARTAAEQIGDRHLHMRSLLATAVTHQELGNYRQGIVACEATLSLFDAQVGASERFGIFPTYTHAWRAFCLARLGEFDRAQISAREAAELARVNGRPEPRVAAAAALGMAAHLRGELAEASEHFEHGLSLCREAGIRVWLPFLTGGLGRVYALEGRLADARRLLDECLAVSGMSARGDAAWYVAWLAEAELLAGHAIEARDVATRALADARARQSRGSEAAAQHVLGEIASRAAPPDTDAAGAHYQAALTLAEELGMRWLVAHCHAGLARVSRNTGDSHAADLHLRTAEALYREMKMTYWLEQARP